MTMMDPLQAFLHECHHHPTAHLALGNAAGDADSLISALAAAYLLSNSNGSTKRIITPVLSIPRVDLETQRPETQMLLTLAGLGTTTTKSLLWFVNQLDDGTLLEAVATAKQNKSVLHDKTDDIDNEIDVTLLDHNRLDQPTLLSADAKVVAIYDHHLDEGCHTDAPVRTIAFAESKATVASTCTLLVEVWQQQQQNQCPTLLSSPSLALLLLGTILLDSLNLQPSAGKVTPRDVAAVEFLLEYTDWSQRNGPALPQGTLEDTEDHDDDDTNNNNKPDTTALFQALQNAKFDPAFWKALSVRDALRLDYKSFSTTSSISFGLSTVLLSAADFVSKENVVGQTRDFAAAGSSGTDMPLFGVMLAHAAPSGGLHRELILCSSSSNDNKGLLEAIVEHLQARHLQLTLVDTLPPQQQQDGDDDDFVMLVFRQGNAKASRKQVAPLLLEYLEANPVVSER